MNVKRKKRPTFIRSMRVDENVKAFLESKDNANEFLLDLVCNTDEFKDFKSKLEASKDINQTKLF